MSAQHGLLSRSARRALVGLCAAILTLSSSTAFASLVIDLRFTDGSTTKDISSMSAGQTVTVQVWATVTGTDSSNSNDGLTFAYFGMTSANTDTAHLTGNIANTSTALSPFTDVASFGNGTFADRNADTIGDWRGTATNGATALNGWPKPSFSLGSPVFGGGSTGQAVNASTWAFHVADAIFTIGSISTSGVSGTQTALKYNVQLPAPTSIASRASWQEDNTTKSGTVGPTLGTSVTFTLTGAAGNTSQILINAADSSTPATGASGKAINFGNVLLNSVQTSAQQINKTGTDATSYSASVGGAATTTFATSSTAIPGGPQNVGGNVGIDTSLYTNSAGTVTIDNLAADSGGAGLGSADANDVYTVSANVGNASTGGNNTFGALFGALVSNTTSNNYAGLASKTTTGVEAGGSPVVGTEARLRGGSNVGVAENVTMAWRARTVSERLDGGGVPASPPLPPPSPGNGIPVLVSDVVQLSGLVKDGGQAGEADPYVLQMSYDPNLLAGGASTEATKAAGFSIYLAWLDPNGGGAGIPEWENATSGDFHNSGGASFGVQGPWDTTGGSTLAVGSWGVDTTNHVVWAVLDHASEFAVVPEPSSLALLGIGVLGLAVGLRKRRQK